MKQPKAIKHACQVLRAKVRYKQASLRLPESTCISDDTQAIREATSLYVETWIVPIIDLIEQGDIAMLARITRDDDGDPMEGDD